MQGEDKIQNLCFDRKITKTGFIQVEYRFYLELCVFYSEEGGGEPSAKKLKVDDSLDGGMKDIAKAKVTEVQ